MEDSKRIDSLDLMKGVIMVLMAIDHVRVYAGVPAGGPDPAVFFTRWITHFVAPGFAFFAGTGIYLTAQRMNDVKALRRFLVTRGLLLVALVLDVQLRLQALHARRRHLDAGLVHGDDGRLGRLFDTRDRDLRNCCRLRPRPRWLGIETLAGPRGLDPRPRRMDQHR